MTRRVEDVTELPRGARNLVTEISNARRRVLFFQLLRRGVHRAAPRAIHTELLPRFTKKKKKRRARPRPIEVSKNPDVLAKQALCDVIIAHTFRLAPARRPRDKTKQQQKKACRRSFLSAACVDEKNAHQTEKKRPRTSNHYTFWPTLSSIWAPFAPFFFCLRRGAQSKNNLTI